MSDQSQGPGWWLATDGLYYPPEQHPSLLLQPVDHSDAPTHHPPRDRARGRSDGSHEPGWWLATDGNFYPPDHHPSLLLHPLDHSAAPLVHPRTTSRPEWYFPAVVVGALVAFAALLALIAALRGDPEPVDGPDNEPIPMLACDTADAADVSEVEGWLAGEAVALGPAVTHRIGDYRWVVADVLDAGGRQLAEAEAWLFVNEVVTALTPGAVEHSTLIDRTDEVVQQGEVEQATNENRYAIAVALGNCLSEDPGSTTTSQP